jgi:hypothetical protein
VGSGVLGLQAATVGCPGTLDDPARFFDTDGGQLGLASDLTEGEGGELSGDAPNCPDVPQTVFLPTCTGSTCHSSQNQAQGLDLQSPNLSARLVNVPSTEGSGLLIDPSAPSSSVLYTKVTAKPPFGARMPEGATPLDSATIACVLAWVTQNISVTSGSEGGLPDDAGAPTGAAEQ